MKPYRLRKVGHQSYAVDRRSDFRFVGSIEHREFVTVSGKRVMRWRAYAADGVQVWPNFSTRDEAASAVMRAATGGGE